MKFENIFLSFFHYNSKNNEQPSGVMDKQVFRPGNISALLVFQFFPADQRLFVFTFEIVDLLLDFSGLRGAGAVKFRVGKQ